MNGQLVEITRVKMEKEEETYEVEEKRVRDEKDEGESQHRKKFVVEIPVPRKVLNRGELMDMDTDRNMGKNVDKCKGKDKDAEKRKVKTQPLWEKIRVEADVTKITDKILEGTVPNLTLKEILSISPELITQWFGIKKVPRLGVKEKDLKEAFEVCIAR